ncbi:glycosyltransferase family 4 protein [Microbacterium sp. IEGM 1404]|uniref:glycosyltransferase family 4 protein n=1 Tax=Microbacterium sp. IEGM 1404 TaxID=3047084 RepID=UPI0024B7F95B|nr:glycosyltransferase family 4 protein [Microbacterium sp. IEGM 1404]MDI9891158.1 glycosyltransferase family 4 protein [Microbacterium sp. IEGM 1404]
MPTPDVPPTTPRVVLHLVDRATGGVPVAVRGYIENSPPGFRHIVASPHGSDGPAAVWAEGARVLDARHVDWDVAHPLVAISGVRALVSRFAPDVVHAHSSFPGVYARAALRDGPRRVYTPHCFAFERRDVGMVARSAYRGIERALRGRADLLAAAGPGEAVAAARLGYPAARIRVIPNVPSVRRVSSVPPAPTDAETLTVGMLGRWAPQKDPDLFVGAVRRLRADLPGVRVRGRWIGGGEGADAAPEDIEVTGWQAPDSVAAQLGGLDVYLHSAAWEAAVAIAILDAVECGVPVLARPLAAMPGLPSAVQWDVGLRTLVAAVRAGSLARWQDDNRARWAEYLGGTFTVEAQRAALRAVWG